ncbi:hypothetical protein ANO11243_039580 [Dothideomycetidae sp. 11243]|nr:hypothetical protein ANO11243_039580 [fungal sp. No.11243]
MAIPKTTASPATASSSTKSKSSTDGPIDMLDSPLARAYTHAHPIIVLAIFFTTFGQLVKDPITGMLGTLVPIAVLQGLYAVICLPGTNASQQTKGKKGKQQDTGIGFRIVPAILSIIMSLTFGGPLLAACLVLFGAPFTTHQIHTMLCGVHLAVLAGPPLIYVHGVDVDCWLRIVALDIPVDDVFGAALGTLLGAWIGAVPIPLDWDREWQKWPVTVLAGAYVGWAVLKMLGGTVLKGSRIRLD